MAATKMIHPPNKNRKLITFIRLGNQKSQKHTDVGKFFESLLPGKTNRGVGERPIKYFDNR